MRRIGARSAPVGSSHVLMVVIPVLRIDWRLCADLREQVKRRFAITVHERTIGKWLRRRKLTRLQPRPAHPCQDLAAQEAFKQILPS